MYTHQGFNQNIMLLDNFSSAMKIEESYRYVFGYISVDKIYPYSSMLNFVRNLINFFLRVFIVGLRFNGNKQSVTKIGLAKNGWKKKCCAQKHIYNTPTYMLKNCKNAI